MQEVFSTFVDNNKWREANEEGRLGAAAISVISMQGDKWRETNEEGRLGAAAISVISTQGDESRETNEEGRLGAAAISVISVQGDKGRRETRNGSDFGNQHANLWEVRAPITSSYLGNEGRLGGSGSDLRNQEPNLWEVRTPIASSYLGKKGIDTCSTEHGDSKAEDDKDEVPEVPTEAKAFVDGWLRWSVSMEYRDVWNHGRGCDVKEPLSPWSLKIPCHIKRDRHLFDWTWR